MLVLLVGEDDVLGRVRRRLVDARRTSRGTASPRLLRADGTTGAGREVWLTTRSAITRMPRSFAVRTNSTRSPSVPSRGSTRVEVGDVVAVVAIGRRVEGHQPEAGDAEVGAGGRCAGPAREVADPVAVPVHVRLDVQAVDDGVLPPQVRRLREPHAVARSSGRTVRAERVEEGVLLLPDVVQVDLVEAQLDVLRAARRCAAEVGRDVDDPCHARPAGRARRRRRTPRRCRGPSTPGAGRRCCATGRRRSPPPRARPGPSSGAPADRGPAPSGVAVGADHARAGSRAGGSP